MSYLATMTTLLSENKNPQHESHIYEFEAMCRQMIEELTPQIVKQTLTETYLDLWVKLQMKFEGKVMYFEDVANYIKEEIIREINRMCK